MLTLFKKFLGYLIAGSGVLFAFCAAMLSDGANRAAVPIVALVVFLAMLFLFSMQAALMHRRVLELLYFYCNPFAFTEAYAPLTRQKWVRKNTRFTALAYLSNGYAAMGEFQMALDTLDELPAMAGTRSKEAVTLTDGNRCSIYLHMGDEDRAERELQSLEKDISRLHGRKQLQYLQNMELLNIRLRLLRGEATQEDVEYLKNRLRRPTSPLFCAEVNYYVGKILLALGDTRTALEYLRDAAAGEGTLWVQTQARQLLKNEET